MYLRSWEFEGFAVGVETRHLAWSHRGEGIAEDPGLRKRAQSSRPPTVVAEGPWHVLQFDLFNLRTVRQILLPRNSPE